MSAFPGVRGHVLPANNWDTMSQKLTEVGHRVTETHECGTPCDKAPKVGRHDKKPLKWDTFRYSGSLGKNDGFIFTEKRRLQVVGTDRFHLCKSDEVHPRANGVYIRGK